MTPFEILSSIIRNRRSIFPVQFNDELIAPDTIKLILDNANWAPSHKLTEPWRFHVVQGKGLERLAKYLGDEYTKRPKGGVFSETKFNKTKQKVSQSAAIIAVVMSRDPKESVPEWEEIAATSMAVQNIWLTCEALGIGTYWSSPSLFTENNTFLELKTNERCFGLMYLGHYDKATKGKGKRSPITEKVIWINK